MLNAEFEMRTARLYAGLAIVGLFVGLSAVCGGLCLVAAPRGDGVLHMPLSLLQGTPFPNYLVPGLVLLIVVGGSNMAGGVLALRRAGSAVRASQIAGVLCAGWIVGEIGFIGYQNWAQVLYLGLGIVTVGLALILARITRTSTPRASRHAAST
jgi:hypothetical protein